MMGVAWAHCTLARITCLAAFESVGPSVSDDLLNEVYQVYGQFSAWKLRNLTHEDQPWKDHQSASDEIPKAELKSYFKTKLS